MVLIRKGSWRNGFPSVKMAVAVKAPDCLIGQRGVAGSIPTTDKKVLSSGVVSRVRVSEKHINNYQGYGMYQERILTRTEANAESVP